MNLFLTFDFIYHIGLRHGAYYCYSMFSRVGVWEAARWIARVREHTCPTCSRSVILKTNMSGGHFGEGGRFMHCEETAFECAFLIKVMGMFDGEMGSK